MYNVKRLIRLVVSDVDGVLTDGIAAPLDFRAIRRIRELNARAEADPTVPFVTFCTGRQQPYLELLLQAIESRLPALWESGAGMYLPATYEFPLNPSLDPAAIRRLPAVRAAIFEAVVAPGRGVFQPGKDVSLTVFPRPPLSVSALIGLLREVVASFPDFDVQDASYCVNIQPAGVDKGAGLRWLAATLGFDLTEVAAIGDSTSDLSFLTIAGWSAAPANAQPDVRAMVDYVSPLPVSEGLLEILERVVERNRKRSESRATGRG